MGLIRTAYADLIIGDYQPYMSYIAACVTNLIRTLQLVLLKYFLIPQAMVCIGHRQLSRPLFHQFIILRLELKEAHTERVLTETVADPSSLVWFAINPYS